MSGSITQSPSLLHIDGILSGDELGGFGLTGSQSALRQFEAAIADLLQALEQQQRQQPAPQSDSGNNDRAGGSGAGDAPAAEAVPTSALKSSAASIPQASAAASAIYSTQPSSASSPFSASSGQTVNIDGGDASGHGVTEQVDNNTGSSALFGWENAQGQVVGELNLQNGQTGRFHVNAEGPDATSVRLIKLNRDGTIPAHSNIDEQNLAVNPNGSLQVSPDVSEITAASDPTQIQVTDGAGKTVGNGVSGGAYLYPTQDQESNPASNPMTMAMDTQSFYDNNFFD